MSLDLPIPVVQADQPAPEPSVVLWATCGRRPMTITDMGLLHRGGGRHPSLIHGGFPKQLSENERTGVTIRLKPIREFAKEYPAIGAPDFAYAQTTTRTFKKRLTRGDKDFVLYGRVPGTGIVRRLLSELKRHLEMSDARSRREAWEAYWRSVWSAETGVRKEDRAPDKDTAG